MTAHRHPPTKTPMTDAQWLEMMAQGLTAKEAAQRTGYKPSSLYRIAKRLKSRWARDYRGRYESKPQVRARKVSDAEWLAALDEGLTAREAARRHGVKVRWAQTEAARLGRSFEVPQVIIPDYVWLQLFDCGLTAIEAATLTGTNRGSPNVAARRLGRQWRVTPSVVSHLRRPEIRERCNAALRASERNQAALKRIGFERFNLHRLTETELDDYRELMRQNFTRPEAAKMIGREDILLSRAEYDRRYEAAKAELARRRAAEEAERARREQEYQAELGELMRQRAAKEGHTGKLPEERKTNAPGPRELRRARVLELIEASPRPLDCPAIMKHLSITVAEAKDALSVLKNGHVIASTETGYVPAQPKENAA